MSDNSVCKRCKGTGEINIGNETIGDVGDGCPDCNGTGVEPSTGMSDRGVIGELIEQYERDDISDIELHKRLLEHVRNAKIEMLEDVEKEFDEIDLETTAYPNQMVKRLFKTLKEGLK